MIFDDELKQIVDDAYDRAPLRSRARTSGERDVFDLLSKLDIDVRTEVPLYYEGQGLRMDFMINIDGKKGAIEFDGEQHFMCKNIWGGDERFNEDARRDSLKDELFKSLKLPMLRIRFDQQNMIEGIVKDFMKNSEFYVENRNPFLTGDNYKDLTKKPMSADYRLEILKNTPELDITPDLLERPVDSHEKNRIYGALQFKKSKNKDLSYLQGEKSPIDLGPTGWLLELQGRKMAIIAQDVSNFSSKAREYDLEINSMLESRGIPLVRIRSEQISKTSAILEDLFKRPSKYLKQHNSFLTDEHYQCDIYPTNDFKVKK